MAFSTPGVSVAAKEAKSNGLKRFEWECSEHGKQLFYSGSGACPCCTVQRKNKVVQKLYNEKVKERYPHIKREDGTWTRKKV